MSTSTQRNGKRTRLGDRPDPPILREAIRVLDWGFCPIPITPPGLKRKGNSSPGKKPIENAWGVERPTPERLITIYRAHPDASLGVLLGPVGGLVDFDIDAESAAEWEQADDTLCRLVGSRSWSSLGWGSARGGHQLARHDDRLRGLPSIVKLGALEIRIGGEGKQLQTVIPPSPMTADRGDHTVAIGPRAWNIPDPGPDAIERLPDGFVERLRAAMDESEAAKRSRPRARNPRIPADPTDDERLAADALRWITNLAVDYQSWLRVGMALSSLGDAGLALWDDWSRSVPEQYQDGACEVKWRTFTPDDGVRLPTVFYLAKQAGWEFPSKREPADWKTAKARQKPEPSTIGGEVPTEPEQPAVDGDRGPLALTDLGNSERFARDHAGVARYVGSWKKWLIYHEGRWMADETGAVVRLAKRTVRGIAAEAAAAADDSNFKALLSWAHKSEDARKIAHMLRLAESEKSIAVSHRRLNADPWLLNVRNGTIDLKAGKLKPHDRRDLITHLAPVDFDPDAGCPMWLSALEMIFGGKADLIAFWQRLCGYWLTGVVREQVLPIAYGKGRNGKSTIIGTLLRILGSEYAYEADPGLIMQRSSDDHPTEKAAMFGKRTVSLSETDSGRRLNEAMVKRLTGKEQITARRMREDPWSFWPTHKLILSTNHRPEIRGTDTAIWRRVLLVPFTVTIRPEDEITDFGDRLTAEDSGILAWCVRGCLEWQKTGLNPPESVTAATKDYRDSQDVLATFIAEQCVVLSEAKVRSGELYQAYCQWAKENGENALGSRTFYEAMADRGHPSKVGSSNRRFVQGIGLRKDDEQSRAVKG